MLSWRCSSCCGHRGCSARRAACERRRGDAAAARRSGCRADRGAFRSAASRRPLDLMQRVLDIGLIGLGFDLLFGVAGLLSFGQAAFFGTGGFVAAYLLVNNIIGSVWLALAIGTVFAGIFGLLVGWLAVRRIGIYFAM